MLDPTLLLTAEEWARSGRAARFEKAFHLCLYVGRIVTDAALCNHVEEKDGMQLVFAPSRWESRRSVDGIPSFPRPSGSG